MSYSSSSSGFEPNSARKFDVFISFRGEDTRRNFTSHLHAALKRASLEVFLDDKKLQKGDEIAPSLIQAIKDSCVSLIVFSQHYASSKWCLDELVHIIKYRKEEGQFVIPIFYNVDPSHVRNQTGPYKEAFENHDKKHDHGKVITWKAALFEAANLSGRHCNQTVTDENNLIEEIVVDVNTKLKHKYECKCASKGLIGIDEMIEPIEELLEKSHKVGIWGMGGVGKTTMTKEVFGRLSSKYSSRCFMENVREKVQMNGLEHVRNSLVTELLGEDIKSISSNASRDIAYVARRLHSRKALVVLDDVNNSMQLMDLQENICNHLAEGSKFIITTREKQLLKANDYELHEAKLLTYDNARQLFISRAFGQGDSKYGYEQLIEEFLNYTKHLPLALKALGSCVRSKDKKLWDSILKKLRDGNPNGEVQGVLRVSYDGLDDKEKKIFLDIACFLKGESEEFVEELLKSYKFHSTAGIETLKDKTLIFVTTSGKVEMHDLIQEMGYQIVREENLDEPGRRSRLWDSNEIYNVLKNCEGENVEGIMMDFGGIEYELAANTFNNMKKLRFLKIRSWYRRVNTRYFSVPTTTLESISRKITYFHWQEYPWKSLPSNFCGELLLELNLEFSLVETLWEGVQDLANLRRLILRMCKKLRELPDFSNACKLESVDLSRCDSLRNVHVSLLCLHSLISLDVTECYSLESLQSNIHLKSLKRVNASRCTKLKEFLVSSEELTSLDLYDTKIEELRQPMGLCSKLRTLSLPAVFELEGPPIHVLSCLTSLKELKISNVEKNDNEGLRVLFDHLHSLQSLHLKSWKNLKDLPDNITQLSRLEELHLDDCWSLTKLPDNMRHLSHLQLLSVVECKKLQSLLELPLSLSILDANGCFSLERVTISSTPHSSGEKDFSFLGCYNLDYSGIFEEQTMRLLHNAVYEKEVVNIIYPGEKVPVWFGDKKTHHGFDNVQLSLSLHNLLGFVFCIVVPDPDDFNCFDGLHDIEEVEMIYEFEEVRQSKKFDRCVCPNHVLLSSSPELSKSILEKIEGKRRNKGATTYNPKVLFKFRAQITSIRDLFSGEPIMIEGGVYPIYASECSDFNFHSRKRKTIQ